MNEMNYIIFHYNVVYFEVFASLCINFKIYFMIQKVIVQRVIKYIFYKHPVSI